METLTTSRPVVSSWNDGSDAQSLFHFRSYESSRIDTLAAEFAAARPFPHIVVDDFLNLQPEIVTRAFPGPAWPGWAVLQDAYQHNKRVCGSYDVLPPLFQAMVQELNGPVFLRLLERITGIRGLIPDPYLNGGGLHSSGPGGILASHADFHHFGRLELFRRLNVLIYFNPGWQREHGGSFELFAKGAQRADREVVPLYGRMVMFLTDDRSIHGFTQPVAGADRWRNSMALYYYTSEETRRFSGDSDTHWQLHGSHGAVDLARLVAYKGLLRIARLFSVAAHQVNPNFRRGARLNDKER